MLLAQAFNEPATWASNFSRAASYALALSSNLWLCLWLIGPNPEDPYGKGEDEDGPEIFWWSLHTGIFVFMAGAEYFAFLGLILDIATSPRSDSISTKHWAFIVVYGYCCAYLLFVYGYNLAFHDGKGAPAIGSGAWTQISDILWMACLSSTSAFLPAEPPLRTKTEVPQDVMPVEQNPDPEM
jgi:hypothetical protein